MSDSLGSSGTPAGPFLPFRPASLLPKAAPVPLRDLTPRHPPVLEGLVVLIVIGMYLPSARLREA